MVKTLLLLPLVAVFVQSIQAWNPIRSSNIPTTNSKNEDQGLDILNKQKRSNELEGLLHSMQQSISELPASTTSSHPSCFFSALSSLPSSSPCESLSHSETSRVETAVRMALCEIKTSGSSGQVPKECQEWEEGGNSKVGGCIEALARSPQSWCSYSGYLREVVTVCSSYRRWADLESAKQLHSSSATQFSDFVDLLQNYEIARKGREEEEGLVKEKILANLQNLSNELTSLTGGLVSQQSQHAEDFSIIHKSLLNSLQSFDESLSSSLDRELGIVMSSMMRQGKDLTELLENSLGGLTTQLRTDLSLASSNLTLELKDSLALLQPSLQLATNQLDQLSTGISKNSHLVNEVNQVLDTVKLEGEGIVFSLSSSLDIARELLSIQAATLESHRDQVLNLTDTIEILLQAAQQNPYSLVNLFRLDNVWWWSSINGFLRGGLNLRGLFFTLLTYLASTSHPFLARMTVILGLLSSIYPFISFFYKSLSPLFIRRIKSPQQLRIPGSEVQKSKSTSENSFAVGEGRRRVRRGVRRGSRIPEFGVWVEGNGYLL